MAWLTAKAGKLALVSLAAFAGGFAAFCATLPAAGETAPDGQAIVVLTGGDDRIRAGLRLLAEGHGERLLISGVHAETSRNDVKLVNDAADDLFSCCVDLGWEARNTPGNATEAAAWARENGYASLVVVTASYHMPRALLELGDQMPDVVLIPYPVMPSALAAPGAWQRPETLGLLASEYAKYIAANARIGGDRLLRIAGI